MSRIENKKRRKTARNKRFSASMEGTNTLDAPTKNKPTKLSGQKICEGALFLYKGWEGFSGEAASFHKTNPVPEKITRKSE